MVPISRKGVGSSGSIDPGILLTAPDALFDISRNGVNMLLVFMFFVIDVRVLGDELTGDNDNRNVASLRLMSTLSLQSLPQFSSKGEIVNKI